MTEEGEERKKEKVGVRICWINQQIKNWLFSEITSSRWQEENNRQLFSVTGIDDHGL